MLKIYIKHDRKICVVVLIDWQVYKGKKGYAISSYKGETANKSVDHIKD